MYYFIHFIPKLVNNLLVSCSFLNQNLLVSHTAHLDKIISFPLLIIATLWFLLLSYHRILLTHYLPKKNHRDYYMSRLKPWKLRFLCYLTYNNLIIDLYFLIAAVIAQVFNPISELVIPIGIPSKEAKAEANH